jgi:hypothetical protein
MPTAGIVVYLNGVAASGTSTLARHLQAAWPEPFPHVGLDHMTAALPGRFLGNSPDADLGARWVTDDPWRVPDVARALTSVGAHARRVPPLRHRADRTPAHRSRRPRRGWLTRTRRLPARVPLS